MTKTLALVRRGFAGWYEDDCRGLSTVEYVIILALIAIAAIGAWTQFGDAIIEQVQSKTGEIQGL